MNNALNTLIQRIEPPFWFSGMHNPELQILFYGVDIAQCQVSTANPVVITNVKRTKNPNFIFVTINTQKISTTEIDFIFKPKNKSSFIQKYELRERRKNSSLRKSFDSSDTIYLLMPDRFANGNKNNDNDSSTTEKYNRDLPGGRHGGDIEGIIQNLDYIQSLGITAIWSTPLCEDNEAEFSYHSYGQSDVYKIDPRFGTNEDYVRLSEEVHRRELKLIMDYVTNHWGLAHWMLNDSPTKDWIHQFENYTQTNHKRSTISDINASKIDRTICLNGWFVPSMPDLNIGNPMVFKYLCQNAIWWIEYANLDGFRVDTYNYSEPEYISKWTKAITDEYPNFNLVGEITMRNQGLLSYWQKDSPIAKIQQFNSNLPSVMDFALSDALQVIFNEDDDTWDQGITKVYDLLSKDFLFPNVNNLLIFGENHDTKRLNHIYNNDIRKYKMAMTMLATIRGIPQLYYGSEIGMAGDQNLGDADIRKDFPGGWEDDENNAFNPKTRSECQKVYFDFTSKLFHWRKTNDAVHFGKTTHYIPENNVYVYFRYNTTKSVMVLINNNPENQEIYTPRFKENIGNYKKGKEVLSDLIFDLSQAIIIEGKSALILELE
ncbi:glycoside hydrolase family 13 protein [Flavobacterium undicola]|uniref:glycoside hydrolase family 13 protein n=1 Tax=Flavobacterium undicola TaxID=1932779 RepID=UPI0013786F5A|nr:glycoside hydrolase family 13 protein [Flavobacterium undicola]MBA0883568.1 glycoside hydrolase family 13 protein [Flavobacterium undicola]